VKVGNLVATKGTYQFIGVILEAPPFSDRHWLVHWFNDDDWTWEDEDDVVVLA
jgi:hypothetical protein